VIRVSIAGDYAVLEAGNLYFYYGYEHVWCNAHGKFADKCGEDCDTEWAFTAKRNGKYIARYRRSSEIDEFAVAEQLLYGLGKYITEKTA
jgi:hypothetical protein